MTMNDSGDGRDGSGGDGRGKGDGGGGGGGGCDDDENENTIITTANVYVVFTMCQHYFKSLTARSLHSDPTREVLLVPSSNKEKLRHKEMNS